MIRALEAGEAEARLDELAAVLVDAVAGGASVNFMAGFGMDGARAFWRAQLPGLRGGGTVLLAAEAEGRLVGTAMLFLAQQPNAPHRAEVGKMLVHSSMRRRGVGRRLLEAVEDAARRAGRTLLMLDTEAGSGGDRLYRAAGWTCAGLVPGHAWRPDGRLAETALFFKTLGPHRAPAGVSA